MASKKKTIINFASLGSIQILNLLLPIITMPYIVSVLGVSNYGLIGFAQSIMAYFQIIVEFGFSTTATRQVSIAKSDPKKLNKIYTNVTISKLILSITCFFILLVMFVIIPKLRVNPLIYLLYFGMIIGYAFFPIWFFQGMEQMGLIGILNFISKLVFTLGIFIFVKSPNSINFIPILNSLGYLIIGSLSLIIVKKKFQVKFVRVSFKDVKETLIESWDLFLTTISGSVFTNSNVFILGLLTNDTITGYFNLAFTIIKICSTVVSPFISTFFPRVAIQFEQSPKQSYASIKKLLKLVTLLFVLGCLILLVFSGFIIHIFFGDQFNDSIFLIRIMAFLPLFYAWENVLGLMVLTLSGYKKILSRIYLFTAFFSLIFLTGAIMVLGANGAAISSLISEVILAATMYIFLKKKKIFFD